MSVGANLFALQIIDAARPRGRIPGRCGRSP
jgi:hypothetical protein